MSYVDSADDEHLYLGMGACCSACAVGLPCCGSASTGAAGLGAVGDSADQAELARFKSYNKTAQERVLRMRDFAGAQGVLRSAEASFQKLAPETQRTVSDELDYTRQMVAGTPEQRAAAIEDKTASGALERRVRDEIAARKNETWWSTFGGSLRDDARGLLNPFAWPWWAKGAATAAVVGGGGLWLATKTGLISGVGRGVGGALGQRLFGRRRRDNPRRRRGR